MSLRKLQKSEVDKVIARGGSVSNDKESSDRAEWRAFNLRLRNDLSKKIDELLIDRPGLSKTAWILEAIYEKIDREFRD